MPTSQHGFIILSGGMASLATADELVRDRRVAAQFDITPHQIGWPFGGKCASRRNLANADGRVDTRQRKGSERLAYQHLRSNIDPSERHILLVQNSTRFRLPAPQPKLRHHSFATADALLRLKSWLFQNGTDNRVHCRESARQADRDHHTLTITP